MPNLPLSSIFPLALLAVLFALQIFSRGLFTRAIRPAQVLAVVAVFGACAFLSYRIYAMWAASELTQYFLPPHNSAAYFLNYVGFRIFWEYITSFMAAVGLMALLKKLDKRFGGNFFESGEIGLAALGVFLTGWPSLLLYVAAVLLVGVVGSLVLTLKSRVHVRPAGLSTSSLLARSQKQQEPGRFPLYFAWAPAAIIVILSRQWLIASSFWVIGFARAF